MSKLKIRNNAVSRLSANISPIDTSISLLPGGGAKFPALAADEWFPATFVKIDGTLEIVRVTARAADVLTVIRGQESTAAINFNAGDRVEHRFTAAAFTEENARVEAIAQEALDASGSSVDDFRDALAADSGATLIGNGDETVAESFNALQLADYTALQNYIGPRRCVYVTGYSALAAPPAIAGMFVADPSDTTSTTNGGTIFVASNGVRWKRQYTGGVDVRWWGAKFDNVADDTAAIQACINYAQPLQKQILLPTGTAKITAQLQVAFSLLGLNLKGQGYAKTRLNYAGIIPATDEAINIIGHSGALCGAVIEGIGFDGNASSTAIVLAGQDGQFIKNCQFGLNFFGVVFRNSVAGSFTEYCIADSCDFTRNCRSPVWYNVIGTGDISFHGSGLRHCTINTPDVNGYSSIVVDPTAVPYNAPMDVQIWSNAVGIFIDMPGYGSGRPYFTGTITTEVLAGSINLCNAPSGKEIPLVGKVAGYNQNFTMGSLFLVDAVIDNSSGSRQTIGGYVAKTQALTTGANAITGIPVCILAGAAEYVVNIYAPNYNYRYLLSAFAKENSGLIPIIATYSAFNSAGWGAPTFSLDPTTGSPIITNAAYPASGVTVTVEATQIGQSFYDPFFN